MLLTIFHQLQLNWNKNKVILLYPGQHKAKAVQLNMVDTFYIVIHIYKT